MTKHIFIIAGEASGDVYGAQLIESLRDFDPEIRISGLGGDRMAKTGMNFLYHLVREFSVMGFIPVILGMPKVMRFLEIILDYIEQDPPDVVVLIDYPGFNLYFATYTKRKNIPTVFYVTPQIWAWAPWRIKKIKRLITKMLVIFPFEVKFYKDANVPVEYVGHPLLDRMSTFVANHNFTKNHQIENEFLAVLPGSRRKEIEKNLATMLWAATVLKQDTEFEICLALSSEKYLVLVQEILSSYGQQLPKTHIVIGDTYNVLNFSQVALVVSGTATLETAILGIPMIVLYRIPHFYKWVVDNTSFLKCDYIALPNIISNKKIVPEYLTAHEKPSQYAEDLRNIWHESEQRSQCLQDIQALRNRIEKPGASKKAAKAIWEIIQ